MWKAIAYVIVLIAAPIYAAGSLYGLALLFEVLPVSLWLALCGLHIAISASIVAVLHT